MPQIRRQYWTREFAVAHLNIDDNVESLAALPLPSPAVAPVASTSKSSSVGSTLIDSEPASSSGPGKGVLGMGSAEGSFEGAARGGEVADLLARQQKQIDGLSAELAMLKNMITIDRLRGEVAGLAANATRPLRNRNRANKRAARKKRANPDVGPQV